MLDNMSFFHFMHCETLTELKEFHNSDEEVSPYSKALRDGLELIGVETSHKVAEILVDSKNDLIDVFEHFGTSDKLTDVLSWIRAPHSVCRLGILVCRGVARRVTRERCETIATRYMGALRNADKSIRYMLTPFRDLDKSAMNTILLSMSIDEDPEEDDELSLTTVVDILDLAPGFYNDGQMRIPFTQGLVRMYKDCFAATPKEDRDVPSSSQQDKDMVESIKFLYHRGRRLKIISPSYFLTKVEECTYMVAMKQAILERPNTNAYKTLRIIRNRWRIVDGLSASGGDPVHLYDLTYFYDILRAEEECIVDREFIKKINWATAELDVLRKTDIMERFKVIYDTIDTVVDLL
jgi:hypothetical protein